MAKESLFNILANQLDFEEIKVLDLFAGTGSISFEFVSRGCSQVTTVEQNYHHHQFIRSVSEKLAIGGRMRMIKGNAFKFCEQATEQYDLIFADPPYDHKQFGEVPALILTNDLLKPNGLFILEHPKRVDFSDLAGYEQTRNYGSVHFSFFRNQPTENHPLI